MKQELLTIGNKGLTDGWRWANFVDCVDILDDKRMPISQSERAKRIGGIPYYGANGQAGWIDDYIFDEEIVLLHEFRVISKIIPNIN